MIFMYLCHALKAGPMKDLASAISGPFALKAGPMKDLALASNVPCLGRLPSRLGL